MHNQLQSTPTKQIKVQSSVPDYIYALLLNSGKHVIGQSNRPVADIAAINSGSYKEIPGVLQIHTIIDVKPQTEERTFAGTVKLFCERFGDGNVIVV